MSHPSCSVASVIRSLTRFQIDGGSNCNFLSGPAPANAALVPSVGTIGGIANGLHYEQVIYSRASLADAADDELTLALLHTPGGDKNILSESVLLDQYGIECPKNPPRVVFPSGLVVPMHRECGLYYADLALSGASPAAPGSPA